MRRRLLMVLLLVALATRAFPEGRDPNQNRGFSPDKVYQLGDLDSVNVQNGNLIVRIPIGQPYTVGPTLTYQVVLTYNGKLWDYLFGGGDPSVNDFRYSVPEKYSNAGFGWLLGFGQLQPPEGTIGQWTYVAPDGATYEFKTAGGDNLNPSVAYASNGASYLRLRLISGGGHEIDFPDGTIKQFNDSGIFVRMFDRYGNFVKVEIDDQAHTWTIKDGFAGTSETIGRTHVIQFDNDEAYDNVNFRNVVSRIDFAASDGATATYLFTHERALVGRGGGTKRNNIPSRCVTVPLLTAVTLPDAEGSQYKLEYRRPTGSTESCDPGPSPDRETLPPESGALTSLTLPTKGKITWTHGVYEMNMPDCAATVMDGHVDDAASGYEAEYVGVTGRTLTGTDVTPEQWSYHPVLLKLGEPQPTITANCGKTPQVTFRKPKKEFVNVVHDPSGLWTVNYFSAYPRGASTDTDPVPFNGEEQGLPITHRAYVSGGSGVVNRLLSMDAFDCATGCTTDVNGMPTTSALQRTYAAYARQPLYQGNAEPIGLPLELQPYEMIGQRTRFEGDNSCSNATCYTDVAYWDFDHYGHFKRALTTSNFPESKDLTTFTGYGPLDTPSTWLLDLYSDSWTKQGTTAAKKIATFDSTRGVMTSLRTLGATGSDPDTFDVSTDDLLTAWCREATAGDQRGYVTSERRFGGAVAIPSDPCGATRVSKQYFLNHEYTFDTSKRLIKHVAKYDGATFNTADEDFDPSTGSVIATRDSAEAETRYKYDNLGRIKQIHPPAQGWTLYTYDRASTPAMVSAQVWSKDITDTDTSSPETRSLKDDYYYYDPLGRLIQSKSRLPNDGTTVRWATTKTVYDSAGRVQQVSMPVVKNTSAYQPFAPTYWTVNTYDTLGRITKVDAPDGTSQSTGYTGNRVRTNSRTMDATTQQRSVEEYDGRGRLVKVTEPSGATSGTTPTGSAVATTYSYDVADRLTQVSIAGPVTQTRTFTYDNRGWLAAETHPEKGIGGNGTVLYSDFDAAGRPWTRTEGSIVSKYTYDFAERLTDVKDGANQPVKSFVFSTANATGNASKGKLATAARFNRVASGTFKVTETYVYGEIGGRVSVRTTKVERETSTNPSTYATIDTFSESMGYEDEFGLPDSITYPTCNSCPAGGVGTIGQVFKRGVLETVTDYATLKYGPTGMVTEVQRVTPATSVDQYAEDRGMSRPSSITFSGLSNCTGPAQPQIAAPASVCPSSTGNVASVSNQVSGVTYAWSITGGTLPSGNTGTSVTFSAGSSGNVTLTVTASNGCGSASSAPSTIAISGPTATLTGTTSINRGQCTNLSVALTGSPSWTLTWTDGTSQPQLPSSPAIRNVCPTVTTTYQLSSVSDGSNCTGTASGIATVTVFPPSPTWINAYAGATDVSLTWPAATGAVSYAVERALSRSGPFVQIATTSALGYSDPIVATSTAVTYVYRVRTKDSANTLSQTAGAPIDFATSFAFTDASLANDWDVKGIHVNDLQKAVDALRAASGLGAQFTNAPSLVDADIVASDFTAVINALNTARAIWGLSNFTYSGVGAPVADDPNSWVDVRHVTQVREAVR